MTEQLNSGNLKLKLSIEETIISFNKWLMKSQISPNSGNYKEFKGIFLNHLKGRLWNNDSYTSVRGLISVRHFEMDWDINGLNKLVFQEDCSLHQGGRNARLFLISVNQVMKYIDVKSKQGETNMQLDDFKRELRHPLHKIDLFSFKTT